MGLLSSFERLFFPWRKTEKPKRVDLKEIFCKRKGDGFIKKFRTVAVGCEYSNPDGSDRQITLEKLKVGEKVRLIWDSGGTGDKNTVYLLRRGKTRELSMPDCFGRLDDKTAADVVRWLSRENIVTSAKVVKILGGTRKRAKYACVLELTTYPGPKKKK